METNLLYRGMNAEMFENENGELKPRGTVSSAMLYPGRIVPSDNLFPGKSIKHGMDKHQNKHRQDEDNFKENSAYLSTTPIYDIAKKYATRDNTLVGYIFIINRTKLARYNVKEYKVVNIANIISESEDEEVLLLTNPHGSCLNSELILDIQKVKPTNS